MQIIGIQILALLFAFFMLYLTFLHYKRDEISSGIFFLWIFLWLAFILLTLLPQILRPLIGPLRIFRVLDLLMLGAFVILTIVSFENHIKNRNLEKKIEKLARKEVLDKIKKKK